MAASVQAVLQLSSLLGVFESGPIFLLGSELKGISSLHVWSRTTGDGLGFSPRLGTQNTTPSHAYGPSVDTYLV
jgi:hypothetical protein